MMLTSYNQSTCYKVIPVAAFLSQYRASSGKTRKKIKFYLLETFNEFLEKDYIKPFFKIQKKNTSKPVIKDILVMQDLIEAQTILISENIAFLSDVDPNEKDKDIHTEK